ncbi:hypothetical protein EJ07DRAFT_154350 [Lizonia empirigonia]|nr:hypothetical protein EJ07DRAFT_154350 [Lizonia empirigonia]
MQSDFNCLSLFAARGILTSEVWFPEHRSKFGVTGQNAVSVLWEPAVRHRGGNGPTKTASGKSIPTRLLGLCVGLGVRTARENSVARLPLACKDQAMGVLSCAAPLFASCTSSVPPGAAGLAYDRPVEVFGAAVPAQFLLLPAPNQMYRWSLAPAPISRSQLLIWHKHRHLNRHSFAVKTPMS